MTDLTRRALLKRGSSAVAAAALAPYLAACGGEEDEPAGRGGGDAANRSFRRAGFVLDVSGSSLEARQGDQYLELFRKIARRVSLDGSGDLYLIFAAGDVLGKQRVYPANVRPEHPDNSALRGPEADEKVNNAVASVRNALHFPPEHTPGSALVETLYVLMSRTSLEAGDAIVMLSDCYQFSPHMRFDRDDTFPAGIDACLDKLERMGYLPDLTGITLIAPYILQSGELKLSDGRILRGEDFWVRYAKRTQAELVREIDITS